MTAPDPAMARPWPREALAGAAAAGYALAAAPAAGLVWAAVAPKLSIRAVANGSDAAFHAQVGADAWFLLIAAVAGAAVATVAVLLAGEPRPALVVGLVAGGVAAALVADRIGFLSQRSATSAALVALGAHPDGSTVSELDFRVRALGVLTAWPLASLLVVGLAIAVASVRR